MKYGLSLLLSVVSAYFCLGTSCVSTTFFGSTEMDVTFAPGETRRTVLVYTTSSRLQLSVSDGVTMTVAVPSDTEELDGSGGEGTSQATAASATSPVGLGLGGSPPTGESGEQVRVTLERSDATDELTVQLQADIEQEGDCSGGPPEKMGIRLEEAEEP